MGDLVEVAVVDGALAVPGVEDGGDGGLELVDGLLRELLAMLPDDAAEGVDELAQRLGPELGVGRRAMLGLGGVQGMLEKVAVDAEHDLAEELDEAPV